MYLILNNTWSMPAHSAWDPSTVKDRDLFESVQRFAMQLIICQNVEQWMYWDAELSEPAQLGNQS